MNLPSLIGSLLTPALFLLFAEHITFRDDRKFDLRVRKTTVQVSEGHQDLARLHLPLLITVQNALKSYSRRSSARRLARVREPDNRITR